MEPISAGITPPWAVDLTQTDAAPPVTTSGDGGNGGDILATQAGQGSISDALQENGNGANTANATNNLQPAAVNNRPIMQGEAVTAGNNQGVNVGVDGGEPKPTGNNITTPANPSPPTNGAMHFANNLGTNTVTPGWLSASSLAQSSLSQSFSSVFASSFATLYLSQPDALYATFSHAVRRSNGHINHHPTHQQQPSPLLAEAFNQLNRNNMLAFTSGPGSVRGAAGLTALFNDADRATLTRMVAVSMRDYSARNAVGLNNHVDAQSLQPQAILAAFGLTHADQLGPSWLAQSTTELIALAQGAGPQEADIIFEALALALLLSSLTAYSAPNGGRFELALAQMFTSMQLLSQMQDPDAFAQMFSRLSPTERSQLLTLLTSLSPNAKLSGLDKMDPIASLFKAFAARSSDTRLGDAQRGAGSGLGGTLGTLLGARGVAGARGDTLTTERLRAELLHFVAAQPASFYYAEASNKKSFHSGRLEAVLQLIVQQLLQELAAKAGRLSRLRCDFADSIELLSNLLDLLTQRDDDDEDSEHSRGHHHAEADDDESGFDETENDIVANVVGTRPHFGNVQNRAQLRGGMAAEYACQTLFRVVPDKQVEGKIAFRWENFGRNAIADLPRQLPAHSAAYTELQQLNEYALASSVAPNDVNTNANAYELLSELLMPSDAAYALGASAAGATIMAKHWHCKMWAHDLTYRLNVDGSKAPFDFIAYTKQQTMPLPTANGDVDHGATTAGVMALPRTETAMRHDLLRMLENSQDRWVREQASNALAAGLQKLRSSGQTATESKGEVVRSMRSPMLRDATIYFLSRYYFKLNAQTADGIAINAK